MSGTDSYRCLLCNGNMANSSVLLFHIHSHHQVANAIADRLVVKCGIMNNDQIKKVLRGVNEVHREVYNPAVKQESIVDLDDEPNRRSIEAPEPTEPLAYPTFQNSQFIPNHSQNNYNNLNQMSSCNQSMNNHLFPPSGPARGCGNKNVFVPSRPNSAFGNDNGFCLNNQNNYPQPGPSSPVNQILNTSQMQQLLMMQQQQQQQQQTQQQLQQQQLQQQQLQQQQLQQQQQQMPPSVWSPIPITEPTTSEEIKPTPSKRSPNKTDSSHPARSGELDFCPYLTNNPRAVSRYTGQNLEKYEADPSLPEGWLSFISEAKRRRFIDSEKKYLFNSKIAVYRYLESRLGVVYTEDDLAKFEKTMKRSSKKLIEK